MPNALWERALTNADEAQRLLNVSLGYNPEATETDAVVAAAAQAHATLALAYAQLARG